MISPRAGLKKDKTRVSTVLCSVLWKKNLVDHGLSSTMITCCWLFVSQLLVMFEHFRESNHIPWCIPPSSPSSAKEDHSHFAGEYSGAADQGYHSSTHWHLGSFILLCPGLCHRYPWVPCWFSMYLSKLGSSKKPQIGTIEALPAGIAGHVKNFGEI